MKLFIEFYHTRRYLVTGKKLVDTINSSFASIDVEVHEYVKTDQWCATPVEALEEFIGKVDRHPECDEVCVSCAAVEEVVLTYLVAERFPEKKFLVGGGGARYTCSIQKNGYAKEVPFNVELTPYRVSKFFSLKKPVFRIPNKDAQAFIFTYSVDTPCPWLKCKFCFDTFKRHDKDCYENTMPDDIVPTFPIETVGKFTVVQISASSISVPTFKKLLPLFEGVPSNVKFMLFIRPDMDVEPILNSGLDMSRFTFWSGLEFPGNRVLNYLNKGTKIEQYLESSKKLTDAGAIVMSSIIVGWNFLTLEDVKEAEFYLFDKRFNAITLIVNRLVHTPYLEMGALIPKESRIPLSNPIEKVTDRWKDLLSYDFYEKLSPEQEDLNNDIHMLLRQTKFRGYQDYEDVQEEGKK